MEKFFKIKKNHYIYKEYFEWYNNKEKAIEKWVDFKKLSGIETSDFGLYLNLYIVPTYNDEIKFKNELLKKEYNQGLRRFKKTSTIQKDWEKFCNANNILFLNKPIFSLDFGAYGKMRTRIFHYKDDVYCSIETESNKILIPEGYEEIKGSKFYKIIETLESEENK